MLTELFLKLFYVSATETGRGMLTAFHFVDEALLLKAEGKTEYVVSC